MYLSIKGKAINIFYTLEGLHDSNNALIGCELLTSLKYRNHNGYIDPEEYFRNVNRSDGIKILRSQIRTAINFVANNKDICFISINVNENLIDYILSDAVLLDLLVKNNEIIVLELSEKLKSDRYSKIKQLSKYCHLWLDDFGKSNYQEQVDLIPFISGIKICHQLILTLSSLECGEIILKEIVNELRRSCKKVIIEGVESKNLYEMTRKCEIDLFQGYFFGFKYLGMAE